MFIFSVSLNDTAQRNNDINRCHYNTNDVYKDSKHQIMYLSLNFPFVSPPLIQEALKISDILAKGEPLPVLVTPMYLL